MSMLTSEVRRAIVAIAGRYKYEPARIMAIVEVESAGRVFWNIGGKNVPAMRPEGHYFYRLLKGEERAKAVEAGLAWPKYSPERAPRTWTASWATFRRMAAINRDVAVMSCSWGLGQVMGSDWKKLNFPNAQAFYDASFSLDGQLDIMLRYIDADGLRSALNKGSTSADSWRPFAKGYNGPAYARLAYHEKMALAYRKYARAALDTGGVPRPSEVDDSEQIKAIQNALKEVGYNPGPVDGKDSKSLRDAIKKFQLDNALDVDGIFGPMTSRRMAEVQLRAKRDAGDALLKGGGASAGVGAIGEKVIEQVIPLQSVGGPVVRIVIMVVILLGVALVFYGLWLKYQAERVQEVGALEEEKAAVLADELQDTEEAENYRGGEFLLDGGTELEESVIGTETDTEEDVKS